jgi:hypothetical protein
MAVEGRDREEHSCSIVAGSCRQHVDIARDERTFGEDHHRVAKLCQHLEAAPREAKTALDGLVGVRDAAHG